MEWYHCIISLFSGCISDIEVTNRSGILDLAPQCGTLIYVMGGLQIYDI